MRREANLWRGAIISPIPGDSSSLCAANPPGLVRVVFLAVSPDCFSGCVARLFFWLCRQVVFLADLPGFVF